MNRRSFLSAPLALILPLKDGPVVTKGVSYDDLNGVYKTYADMPKASLDENIRKIQASVRDYLASSDCQAAIDQYRAFL